MRKSPDQLRKLLAVGAATTAAMGSVACGNAVANPFKPRPSIAIIARQINKLPLKPAAKMGGNTLVYSKQLPKQQRAEIAIGSSALAGNKVVPSKVSYIDIVIRSTDNPSGQDQQPTLEYLFNKSSGNKWTVGSTVKNPFEANSSYHAEEIQQKRATTYTQTVVDGKTRNTNLIATDSSFLANAMFHHFERATSEAVNDITHNQVPSLTKINNLLQ